LSTRERDSMSRLSTQSSTCQARVVILGGLSIQGNIKPMRSLAEPLQVAMDNGARKALIPLENKRNFLEVSGDIVERVDPVFFYDPIMAAMKAGKAVQGRKDHRRIPRAIEGGMYSRAQRPDRVAAFAEKILESEKEGIGCMAANVTHKENSEISESVRARMKEQGKLTNERVLTTHQTLGWTDAQKKEIRKFKAGHVLEMTQGKDKGQSYMVESVKNDHVCARRDGKLRLFTSKDYKLIDVCEAKALPVAIGDDNLS
jgi:hypothetical protein